MPRFVILEHDYPELHWDFMLEEADMLRTWKLTAPPDLQQSVSAQLSFDHRKLYLNYEGPISGCRGKVVCWDRGSFTWKENGDGHVQVDLQGGLCSGLVDLTEGADNQWQLTLK